jgi:hypothetical protein
MQELEQMQIFLEEIKPYCFLPNGVIGQLVHCIKLSDRETKTGVVSVETMQKVLKYSVAENPNMILEAKFHNIKDGRIEIWKTYRRSHKTRLAQIRVLYENSIRKVNNELKVIAELEKEARTIMAMIVVGDNGYEDVSYRD